jgi:hypothetical protein
MSLRWQGPRGECTAKGLSTLVQTHTEIGQGGRGQSPANGAWRLMAGLVRLTRAPSHV